MLSKLLPLQCIALEYGLLDCTHVHQGAMQLLAGSHCEDVVHNLTNLVQYLANWCTVLANWCTVLLNGCTVWQVGVGI